MTAAEIGELREEMDAQREEIRAVLADKLGGDPDDYRAEDYLADQDSDHGEAVPDGGE